MDETLIQALRARLEAASGEPVRLLETHISWILLAGQAAYKVKKPVRLPFVDFGTLAARQHFCRQELRLNRRLAPQLYLDVLPITGSAQAPELGGSGPPIEWALHMRRFPDGALFSERLAADALRPEHLDALALRLADFHAAAPVCEERAPDQVWEHAVRPTLDVLEQLAGLPEGARAAPIAAWVREQAERLRPVFVQRQAEGRVRDGHGDLHLANVIVLEDGAASAFDCLEFDDALRRLDVMSDIGFLTMDLKAHGRADLAFRFLDGYLQRGGDYAGLAVLRFYEVHRALVRALVGALRGAAGAGVPDVPDYLACAAALIAETDRPRRLAITFGLSGSGKSTVAAGLAMAAHAIRLRSDVERKRLFGLAALDRSAEHALEIYTADANTRTMAKLRALASAALAGDYPVIVDATFLRRAERAAFAELAARHDAGFAILHCDACPSTLRARVAQRERMGGDASEASAAVLERQLATHEALNDAERQYIVTVSTEQPVDAAALARRWLSGAGCSDRSGDGADPAGHA
ncbi:AAA family ATPase [Verticiella sediminum]|uniref:AAA family ATPase n=1 Tax=Verticiella sediminum TaxID=1247510 RepID=A0A556AJS4_9BURK|nr:bifunctional aminoglycoside phosphotransferase/ATP-binding protein [Verticiella sediminum]TSH93120.1 AAA family ATPase [Verticiella sediminum]